MAQHSRRIKSVLLQQAQEHLLSVKLHLHVTAMPANSSRTVKFILGHWGTRHVLPRWQRQPGPDVGTTLSIMQPPGLIIVCSASGMMVMKAQASAVASMPLHNQWHCAHNHDAYSMQSAHGVTSPQHLDSSLPTLGGCHSCTNTCRHLMQGHAATHQTPKTSIQHWLLCHAVHTLHCMT
jgi:hypothetical protein